jgi:alpha/beta superfamily hydrolase
LNGDEVTAIRKAQRVVIPGPAGGLEGLIETPAEPLLGVALICHPHPLHQGTMNNKVVFTLARTFTRLGSVAVRFNFRGVGRSQGSYAEGVGETDDAIAVGRWMRNLWPRLPFYLGGFSFGAKIALQAAAALDPDRLVVVAPPVARLQAMLAPPRCPWLVVQGESDDVVSAQSVVRWAGGLARRPQLVVMRGAGHFFHGRLGELAEDVTRFLQGERLTEDDNQAEVNRAQSS